MLAIKINQTTNWEIETQHRDHQTSCYLEATTSKSKFCLRPQKPRHWQEFWPGPHISFPSVSVMWVFYWWWGCEDCTWCTATEPDTNMNQMHNNDKMLKDRLYGYKLRCTKIKPWENCFPITQPTLAFKLQFHLKQKNLSGHFQGNSVHSVYSSSPFNFFFFFFGPEIISIMDTQVATMCLWQTASFPHLLLLWSYAVSTTNTSGQMFLLWEH